MKAAIINVGTELLMGSTLNTHAQYLSMKLSEVGVSVYAQAVVGDNAQRLKELVGYYFETVDLIVLTGGLGPTDDDLTKETVSEVMGVPLYLDEAVHKDLLEKFSKFNRTMTENNLKQAYVPTEGDILWNSKGTAPGCIFRKDGKLAILLPGPPRELYPMFENSVMPYLKSMQTLTLTSKYIRFFGIGESALETELKDLFDAQTNPTLATYAKPGEVMLRVTAAAETEANANEIMVPTLAEVIKRVGSYIYSFEDEELETVLVKSLQKMSLTMATAESCTGGIIASKVVNISGASSVYLGSVVAYSNALKEQLLSVPLTILETHGAVSEETAKAMSEGLAKCTGADVCISTTGIAGPEGGSLEKPVGLVYVDILFKGQHVTKKLLLTGDRDRIRNQAALNALHMAISVLL